MIGYWLWEIVYSQVAMGIWLLAIGCWLLTISHRVLAIGDRLLAIFDWRWRLAIGFWPSMIRYWLLAFGYWLLTIGYWRFAMNCWTPTTYSLHLFIQCSIVSPRPRPPSNVRCTALQATVIFVAGFETRNEMKRMFVQGGAVELVGRSH